MISIQNHIFLKLERNMYRFTYYKKEYILSLLLLFIGGMIYVLYRPQNILLFRITDVLGIGTFISSIRESSSFVILPSICINSVPAGLWTASYLILMYCNTKFYSKKTRMMLSLPLPVSMIVLEFMQLFGWCPGTFDFNDLICYVIPLIIFIKSI